MTAVWFTSDLHIGHGVVAQARWDRVGAQRWASYGKPAPSLDQIVEWHDWQLSDTWDDRVGRDDQVWVLGDLAAGGTEALAYALNWIADRPGEKHLISGNHDQVHPMHRDAHKWQSAYRQVFASVQPFARRKIGDQRVLLSHFPYVGDHTTESRFDQYRLPDHALPILHGHTHSTDQFTWTGLAGFRLTTMQVHVGVDAWDLGPVHIDRIAELLQDGSRR